MSRESEGKKTTTKKISECGTGFDALSFNLLEPPDWSALGRGRECECGQIADWRVRVRERGCLNSSADHTCLFSREKNWRPPESPKTLMHTGITHPNIRPTNWGVFVNYSTSR